MPFANCNGISIHYSWVNPSLDTAPIVFLHEALGSIGQWKGFPQELCDALQCKGLVYERQGHGHSDAFSTQREADYMHRYALNELPALLTALNIDKVHLFGHSDGGSIALIFAATFPKICLSVVSEAAHVVVEDETIGGIAPAVEAYTRTSFREKLRNYHGSKTDALFEAWSKTWQSNFFRDWNIINELPNIQCPVLALQGDADEYGTPLQLELIQKHTTGRTELELIANCKHIPHLQQKDKVMERVGEFWRSMEL
jgi:pimeloyl-ACP methyl ester carboxylesterase